MSDPDSTDLQTVIELLPDDAGDYGWTTAKALERWAGTVYRTVREFWVDRVNDTAGFIDLTNDGLPASQLYRQARDMLDYWDKMIAAGEVDPDERTHAVSRRIRRV